MGELKGPLQMLMDEPLAGTRRTQNLAKRRTMVNGDRTPERVRSWEVARYMLKVVWIRDTFNRFKNGLRALLMEAVNVEQLFALEHPAWTNEMLGQSSREGISTENAIISETDVALTSRCRWYRCSGQCIWRQGSGSNRRCFM